MTSKPFGQADGIVSHLGQRELARRWKISERSLERWRWQGVGPRYVKVGGRVRYRLKDIETYEEEQLRSSTADTAGPGRSVG